MRRSLFDLRSYLAGEARTKEIVSWNCIAQCLSCRSTRLAARRVDALFMRSMYACRCSPAQNLKPIYVSWVFTEFLLTKVLEFFLLMVYNVGRN